MADSPRQRLLAKIKALLEKTVAHGCTEGEAMLALEKARALMDAHEITDTDLTFAGERVKVHTEPKDDRDNIRDGLALAVGAFCACVVFKNGFERISYVGLDSDTIFAHWLLDTLDGFVRRELESYLSATPRRQRVRRLETNGFVAACVTRISHRLHELAKARRAQSTAVALKRNALIADAMKNAGIRQRERFTIRTVDTRARDAGDRAGQQATFDKPLNDGNAPKALT